MKFSVLERETGAMQVLVSQDLGSCQSFKQKTEGAQTGVFGENLDTNKGGARRQAGWLTLGSLTSLRDQQVGLRLRQQ